MKRLRIKGELITKNRFYSRWAQMKNRCYNVNDKDFWRWGGKGVYVCDEWLNDSRAFIKWCEEQNPAPGLTLDRFPDRDGPYAPWNCRWATAKQQGTNRRDNVEIEYEGKIYNFADLVKTLGVVSVSTAYKRIEAHGWDRLKAATTPTMSFSEANKQRRIFQSC